MVIEGNLTTKQELSDSQLRALDLLKSSLVDALDAEVIDDKDVKQIDNHNI